MYLHHQARKRVNYHTYVYLELEQEVVFKSQDSKWKSNIHEQEHTFASSKRD